MSGAASFRQLALMTLILAVMIFGLVYITRPGKTVASAEVITPQPKIILVSQSITGQRLTPGYRKGPVYRMKADYRFRNDGDECTASFAMPPALVKNSSANERVEISDDGSPIELTPHPEGDSASAEIAPGGCGWRSSFASGQTKVVTIVYYIEPETKFIWDKADINGAEVVVTKLPHIFQATYEEAVIPVGLMASSTGAGKVDVAMDIGKNVPPNMVFCSPDGFSSAGGKLSWSIDNPDAKSTVKIGILRVGDAIYDIAAADEIIRTITDSKYPGYIKTLNISERKGLLKIARNGIFARHGYIFNGELADYFGSLAWYKPNPKYSDNLLTLEDIEMVKRILLAEKTL